jgi:hypothetical protein
MMRKIEFILFSVFLLASPMYATTYFLAPASGGGSDSNSGLSASAPWVSPNHALNCGDTIIAAASTAYGAFVNDWGAVSCAAGNNVAWLTCAKFDACKITVSNGDGMRINQSYWGVQGWEVTANAGGGSCFAAVPPSSIVIHHIIFANVVANGCQNNGINSYNLNGGGVDYFVVIGSAAYNAAQGNSSCYSGISVYEPIKSDSVAGTHIFVAGNYSWGNLDPNPCLGIAPVDGEGIIFDTFDGSQQSVTPYNQQAVMENNLLFFNGGKGFQVFNNMAGSNGNAPIYVTHNTLFGNATDPNEVATWCGDSYVDSAKDVQETYNLVRTNAAAACAGMSQNLFAFWVSRADASVVLDFNYGYSAAGHNVGSSNATAFAAGSHNVFGTDPGFANPVNPGAPSCSGKASVPDCMSAVLADFQPRTAAAQAYGIQAVVSASGVDPLFPQWLCNVNLPAGLVTLACLNRPQPPTGIRIQVN